MVDEARLGRIARQRRRLSWRVGLFVAATLGLIGLILSQLVHLPAAAARYGLSGEYRLMASFENVVGLVAGDPVKIAGVPVGTVEDIAVVKGKAQVTMLVSSRVRLARDSEAAIRARNQIGQKSVYLLPGRGREMLRDGMWMSRPGRSAIDLGELLNDLYPLSLDRDPGYANTIIRSLSTALDGGDVDEMMRNTEVLAGAVADRKTLVVQMIKDTKAVTATIARRDRQIARMVENLTELSGKFTDNRRLIDAAVTDLSAVTATTDKLLGRNAGELGGVVGDLERLTGGTRRNVRVVDGIMRELVPFSKRSWGPISTGDLFAGQITCLSLNSGPECPHPMQMPQGSLRDLILPHPTPPSPP